MARKWTKDWKDENPAILAISNWQNTDLILALFAEHPTDTKHGLIHFGSTDLYLKKSDYWKYYPVKENVGEIRNAVYDYIRGLI
jgi:hypothetical protein